MISKLCQAIKLDRQAVAIVKTNTPPEEALQFRAGSTGCVIAMLSAASKGRTAVFQESTTGCPGGKAGLGFVKMNPDSIADFLSVGNENQSGEFYKKTPSLAATYVNSLPETTPLPCVVFYPLDQLPVEEIPVSVVFLVNADQLSGLITLANFDRDTQDNVVVHFGSGCSQAILYSMCDSEAGKDLCTVGITDPSGRLHLDKNLLSFSIPYARFLEMEDNVENSFLTKQTWHTLSQRI